MNLLFAGTGAADYESAFTCPCPTCSTIRAQAGRNLRHYSSLLVNGSLLVDCGPTVPWRLAELGIAPAQVETLVFTHSHEDHLDPEAVASLVRARGTQRGPLPVYGNAASLGRLVDVEGLERHPVRAGETVNIPGFSLTALCANHLAGELEETLVWLISDAAGALLYATDTAWPPVGTWEALVGTRLSAVVAEATFGLLEAGDHPDLMTHHLNWPEFLRLREELIAASVITPATPFVATHLSLHFVPPHEEFSLLAEAPVSVAYDGLWLTV